MGIRLVKYLAQCGAASRRGAADLVREGRVLVNGQVAVNVAYQVEPGDHVLFDGKPVAVPSETRIFLLHKPLDTVAPCAIPTIPKPFWIVCLRRRARA